MDVACSRLCHRSGRRLPQRHCERTLGSGKLNALIWTGIAIGLLGLTASLLGLVGGREALWLDAALLMVGAYAVGGLAGFFMRSLSTDLPDQGSPVDSMALARAEIMHPGVSATPAAPPAAPAKPAEAPTQAVEPVAAPAEAAPTEPAPAAGKGPAVRKARARAAPAEPAAPNRRKPKA